MPIDQANTTKTGNGIKTTSVFDTNLGAIVSYPIKNPIAHFEFFFSVRTAKSVNTFKASDLARATIIIKIAGSVHGTRLESNATVSSKGK